MGFIKKLEDVMQTASAPRQPVGRRLNDLSPDELEAHIAKDTFGDFKLTQAVRPALHMTPEEGYKYMQYPYSDKHTIPIIMASVSRKKLFDLFLRLSDEVGETVDVVLETSHKQTPHVDIHRESIDNPVLRSTLIDYEHLLLNDGCTGVSVLNQQDPKEVKFDEHKLLIIFAKKLKPFAEILDKAGVREKPRMKLITQDQHIHSTNDDFYEQFRELTMKIAGFDPEQESDF